jgi:probable rRNA maturation factor
MPDASKYTIEIANQQSRHKVPQQLLRKAARAVLQGEGIQTATISLAIVDDPTMHQLNREYLKHDYPTDVLSFVLDRDGSNLDGEIVVSADMAASRCPEFGWSAQDEITLYVVHGMLHLIGFDDHSPADRRRMRLKEQEYLRKLKIVVKRT